MSSENDGIICMKHSFNQALTKEHENLEFTVPLAGAGLQPVPTIKEKKHRSQTCASGGGT